MICVTRLNGVFLIGLKSYPRRCGENAVGFFPGAAARGSSPQVRGKRFGGGGVWWWWRLIPAGAGKTAAGSTVISRYPAHPRRCGENRTTFTTWPPHAGSSPQVRGKLGNPSRALSDIRLIPAGAGKTTHLWRLVVTIPAHPRRCGENYYPW